MKIIGAGLGRTGTKSLQVALEKLGFKPCYHMEALFRNPKDVSYWIEANKGNDVDWKGLFENYEAAVDFPVAMYYKELAEYFPDAKVILSVRDPEGWYQSARKTIYSFDPGIGVKLKMLFRMPFSSIARNLFKVIQLNDKAIWKEYFEGKFEDKEYAIQKFNIHIQEVKTVIPEERLLIYKVGDGWELICTFLDCPIPDEPYPHSNKKDDFNTWAKSLVHEVLS